MSHQSGITGSEELKNFFASSKDGHVRLIKVGIDVDSEQLVLQTSKEPNGTWEEDYDKLLVPLLEPKQPCYVFYRLDSKNNQGYEWIYICYSPDFSPVRQKMLYAATQYTLRTEFGGGQVKDQLYGTTVEDVNLAGYKKHKQSESAPAPLTMAEEELMEIKKTEVNSHIGVDTKHQTISGVAFPIDEEALNKLNDYVSGTINFVQLKLDIENETINLDVAEDVEPNSIASKIPSDQGRYLLYNFKHTHEGDYMQSNVFIYYMPGYKCPIKERMLYSACKAPAIDVLEDHFKIELARKIEIDDPKEVNEEWLYDEIHPKKNIATSKFAKPKGPGGRGPKRLTKASNAGGGE